MQKSLPINSCLISLIVFGLLSVVVLESVACGELLDGPRGTKTNRLKKQVLNGKMEAARENEDFRITELWDAHTSIPIRKRGQATFPWLARNIESQASAFLVIL